MEMKNEVVILGAGPAGMMLAWQLVTQGVPVRVLERNPDFQREFRGELIQARVVEALEGLGLLSQLAERGLARLNIERRMFVGLERQVFLPTGPERGALISQPGMLGLLHELCSRHPHYRLDFGTTVLDAVLEGGKVVAVKTRSKGVEGTVPGSFFVDCSGRSSVLRKAVNAPVEPIASEAGVLWLKFDFSDAPEALTKGVDVHIYGHGLVVVHFATTGGHLQLAYSSPEDLVALRKDVAELKRKLLPRLPEALRPHIERKLTADTESQIFRVGLDRLRSWHAPGVLFLGDAAHTMSPSGAQGLNLALRDSLTAAEHLLRALRAGKELDASVLQPIEDERRPEVVSVQAGQLRAHRMCEKPLFVSRLAFGMLGLVMAFKKAG
jgi:2-polyprenyl-6-methoxyphenol hydroxylase-like FAD-dependent oxidoreductase